MNSSAVDLNQLSSTDEIILSCDGEHIDLPPSKEAQLEVRTLQLLGDDGTVTEFQVPLAPGRTLEELGAALKILQDSEIRHIHIGEKSADLAELPLSRYIQSRIAQVAPGMQNGYVGIDGVERDSVLDDPHLRIRENASPYDKPEAAIPVLNELVIIDDISVMHIPGVTLPPSKTAYSVGKWVAEDLLGRFEQQRNAPVDVLELCSGSGVINLSLIKNAGSMVKVLATDISQRCVNLNEMSARANEVHEDQLSFGVGDLYDAVPEDQKFDYIVANPPFFSQEAALKVVRDLRYADNVPLRAIDGGDDGLEFYRRILAEGLPFLKPGGKFVFEVSPKISPLVRVLSAKFLPRHPRAIQTISDGKDVGHIAKGFIVAIEPF